ncbi:hypothetical protein GCM10010873_05420 [Cypionkella aquatica]|uniref:Uncharacterized protein n=1 Tax=Cypionkella aquatica TaxID=1756042 RepID=A0AA37U0H5_9RHOB|nr:hypothetical protein [Cypionkella aquatica]GLS85569.1 hypothetical protein GCM10010873_05420 [Cypionkella aquatica]
MTSFKASDRTYDAMLLKKAWACGLHQIDQVIRINVLRAQPRRHGKPKDDGERTLIAGNILEPDFQSDWPNQNWLADFTYIWTAPQSAGCVSRSRWTCFRVAPSADP